MSIRFYFSILVVTSIGSSVCFGQNEEATAPVEIRVVLHDPIRPVADLYYLNKEGEANPVKFRMQALSRPFVTVPVEGSLIFYDTNKIDPKDPDANLNKIAAIARVPAGIKRAIVLVAPGPEGKKPAYRLLIIDDSEKSFPGGESLVLPLLADKVVVEAGEHTVRVRPGKLTRIPFVEEKNEFNIAQTNFHYYQEGRWITFAERQLQYLEACRRLFIIHYTPGSLQPTVTTIVDINSG